MYKPKSKYKEPEFFIDPVCCMKVQKNNKALMYTYKMRTYYFCADTCRSAFVKNPEDYLTKKPIFTTPKIWWNRYLKRLNKATGGKSINCH